MSKKITLLIASTLAISTQAWGHANFVPKDNLDNFTGRAYKEGSSAYFKLNIAHSCKNESGSKYYPTRDVSIVFPNSEDLLGIAYTSSHGEGTFGGNAMMSIKPRVSRSFKKIKIFKSDVPEFNNHGLKDRDIRGIHWKHGWVPNYKYEVLEFRASLPKLEPDSCVKQLRVYTPVVQYCSRGRKLAWLKTPTRLFGEEIISPNYAPYFDILRDEENNPLPAGCSVDSMKMEIYPSDEDIDTYLALKKHQKPSGHPEHESDNDNGGGHTNHGSDNDNGGGHDHGGGTTDSGTTDDSTTDGGHTNHGSDNDNGGGHDHGGGTTDGGTTDSGTTDDSTTDGGHTNHGSDNDNGGGHDHGGGTTDGGTTDSGTTDDGDKPLTAAELRGKAFYVQYGCADSACHGSDPSLNEKNVLAGADHVFFMATMDRVPEMAGVKEALGDDHRTMLDINDYLASFK